MQGQGSESDGCATPPQLWTGKDVCPSDSASICGAGMLIITAVHVEITDMHLEFKSRVAMLEAAHVRRLMHYVCWTALVQTAQAPGACVSYRYASSSDLGKVETVRCAT
jgi:hypothetical protein